jgi:adhesin HecA-like repeat protein
MVGSVLAATYTISDDTNNLLFQDNISKMNDGDILLLNPGTYYVSGITYSRNITIGANTEAGGNQVNTIVDGIGGSVSGWGILRNTGTTNSLTINNLTLRNGQTVASGGAIYSNDGAVTIISSTFYNCSTLGSGSYDFGGGAIYARTVTVTTSTFLNCSADASYGSGGAIRSHGNTIITLSTFSNCSAKGNSGYGSVIYDISPAEVTVISSIFSNCMANGYGGTGGVIYSWGNVTVTSSTFVNCSAGIGAGYGGVVYTKGNVTLASSSITGCSAGSFGGAIYSKQNTAVTKSTISDCSVTLYYGGAIYSEGNVTITSSTIANCTANNQGGAIQSGGDVMMTSSTIFNCSAISGGVIMSGFGGGGSGAVTVTGGTITNCSATNGGHIVSAPVMVTIMESTISNCSVSGTGSAIYYAPSGTIQFCRLTDNSAKIARVGTINATHNWWGSNDVPSEQAGYGVIYSPWLMLRTTATPASITTAQTSVVEANLTVDSDGIWHDPALGHVPDGIPITYTWTTGSLTPSTGMMFNGANTTVFSPSVDGLVVVNATVDGQTISTGSVASGSSGPVANFTVNQTSGTVPLAVQFTDVSTGTPTSWNWSFGDGGSSTLENPAHVYQISGNYTVSLNVTNDAGFNITTKVGYINVTPQALVAAFSGTPVTGPAPMNVVFTDLSTGFPTGWSWFFGDENYKAPWKKMNASAGWSTRANFGCVPIPDGSILVMGGNGFTLYNDVWKSRDNGATWSLVNASAGWTGRYRFGTVVLPDGSIILMGGYDRNNRFKSDVWMSEDKGATWSLVNTSAGWAPRERFSTSSMPDGSVIISGGYGSRSGLMDGSQGDLNDVWRSVDRGATWIQMNATPGWVARASHSTVGMPDGSLILMGGYNISGQGRYNGLLNDTWRSSDNGSTWYQLTPGAGWSARLSHSSVTMPDGSIVLMGGNNPWYGDRSDVWRSINGANWTLVNISAGWTPRSSHRSVVMTDGSIVLMGGDTSELGAMNDTWRMMPAGSSNQNPSHTFTSKGIYQVTLLTYNADSSDFTRRTINVTGPPTPIANFIATPTSGNPPMTVQFISLSTGNPRSWSWSFGDGTWFNTTTAGLANTTHVYRKPGTFTVSLTVGNNSDRDTRIRSDYITILPREANLTFQPVTASIDVGAVTNYTILLENAPQGLSGYNVTVDLSDPTIGKIRRVYYPTWSTMSTNSTLPADKAWFRAVDLSNKSGTLNITLCTISLQADTPGTAVINVTPVRIEDRSGGWYNVTYASAELTVASLDGRFPKPGGGHFPAATDPDGDGKYEDLDGNDWIGFNDVVLAYNNLDAIDAGAYGLRESFDYDGSGWFGFNDIVVLFGMT